MGRVNVAPKQQQEQSLPPIATQCFMLSNMFDPITERDPHWDQEIRDDVIEECNKHGGVAHIYVDKASPQGNVYVKCPNISTAVAASATKATTLMAAMASTATTTLTTTTTTTT